MQKSTQHISIYVHLSVGGGGGGGGGIGKLCTRKVLSLTIFCLMAMSMDWLTNHMLQGMPGSYMCIQRTIEICIHIY